MRRFISAMLTLAFIISLAVVSQGTAFAASAPKVSGSLCGGTLTVTVSGVDKAVHPQVTLWIKNLSANAPDIDAVTGKPITMLSQTVEVGKNNNTVSLIKRKGLSYRITAVLKNADGSDGDTLNPVTIDAIGVSYEAHVQKIGWQAPAADGAEAGTEGKGLRIEALKMNLTGTLPQGASIIYKAYIQGIGWKKSVADGAQAGITGQNRRIEAVRITLKNMPGYAVTYRAHIQKLGWSQGWKTTVNETGIDSAALTGTTNKGYRIEAIEVKIVKA